MIKGCRMVKGMDIETACYYLKVRDKVDDLIEKIYASAYIMSLLFDLPQEHIRINSHAIGYLGKMIADDVLRITEHLDDDFVSTTELKLELEDIENET